VALQRCIITTLKVSGYVKKSEFQRQTCVKRVDVWGKLASSASPLPIFPDGDSLCISRVYVYGYTFAFAIGGRFF
jgi:hypothetical protein